MLKRKIKYKLDGLMGRLSALEHPAVAFSGGVDSTFLLAAVKKALAEKVLALTVDSAFVPRSEIALAKEMAEKIGVEHVVLQADVLGDAAITENTRERCYHCKRYLFERIVREARARGFSSLVHAVNRDDLGDFRPGLKAAGELGFLAPLADAGMTKADIRQVSKEWGLDTWDKPSQSCLAARIPYGTKITGQLLARIETAEDFLHGMGLEQVRVRCHGNLARIEVPEKDIAVVMDTKMRAEISTEFKKIGFTWISVDLTGYETGKMNHEILTGEQRPDICDPA